MKQSDITTVRTRPHRTKLWLSVYQPDVILACQLNNAGATQGIRLLAYDEVTEGSYTNVKYDQVMYVGTTPGGSDKGRIRVRSASNTIITVAENTYINWADDDYLTIVDFYEIVSRFPRIIQNPADETQTIWYKDYDIAYSNQNTKNGAFICMGSHYAGFVENDVYYSASGTVHVNTGTSLGYYWSFEGGTPSGSTALTPGYISYATPGHYTTQLSVSGSNGSADVSYRHVSIYDRPGEGDNTPILTWELAKVSGSRGAGGYRTTIRIREEVPTDEIRDGSLVVIFSDDWYGDTKISLDNNIENRGSIFFVGYVVDGTINFDYANNYIEFEVESPTGIAKLCEAFSVSIEDIDDPVARANEQPGYYPSPWTLLPGLNVSKALYHYIRWHSTLFKCADFQFLNLEDDRRIQYADFDRESLYSAMNELINGALWGNITSDLQGKIWAEVDTQRRSGETNSIFVVDNQDWVGDVSIEEILSAQVSFIEGGGIHYSGFTGSSTPYLAGAPGESPGYRGKIQRIQGLALSSQNDLNSLIGIIYSFENRKYPGVRLKMAGNYRFLDIAPQIRYPISIPASKNPRGNAINESFYIENAGWTYDPRKEQLFPSVGFTQIPTPITASTLSIPIEPPSEGENGGFEVPPFEFPPFSIPPMGGAVSLGQVLLPAYGGHKDDATVRSWQGGAVGSITDDAPGVLLFEGIAGGAYIVPNEVTGLTLYPILYGGFAGDTKNISIVETFIVYNAPGGEEDIEDGFNDTRAATINRGMNIVTSLEITLNVDGGQLIHWYSEDTAPSSLDDVSIVGYYAFLNTG